MSALRAPRRPGVRAVPVLVALAALAAWDGAAGPAGAQGDPGPATRLEAQEYDLKTVYLYNFIQFFQWPDASPGGEGEGAAVIGIVGRSPFGGALEELEHRLREGGMRPVRFVLLGPYDAGGARPEELRRCRLVFVAPSEREHFGDVLAALDGAPVVTVADSEGFLEAGGMINLVRSGGKVRWTVNRAAVERSGLRINAQLLSLALGVTGGP